MFLTEGKDRSIVLYLTAIVIYESNTQEFLKRVLVLLHIPLSQLLQEPKLLSIIQYNTARQRYLLLQEKLVMVYTQYHKGQQQLSVYKDNVCFLPKAIKDLLLDYTAYILLLQQMFLRQQKLGALISPYLQAKLDGTVQANRTLSACLGKAYACAQVLRLHTSNWRHFLASICKEKFLSKERANFELKDNVVEDIEDKLDLIAIAEQSNHIYYTFNYVYTGTTRLTINTLLHWNY